jgi:hypothetical protein
MKDRAAIFLKIKVQPERTDKIKLQVQYYVENKNSTTILHFAANSNDDIYDCFLLALLLQIRLFSPLNIPT